MDWAHTSPPNEILWAGLVLTVVALVVAVPSALQMLYGGPNLRVGWQRVQQPESFGLACLVYNAPVRLPWLRLIGVRRETARGVFALLDLWLLPGRAPLRDHPFRLWINPPLNEQAAAESVDIQPSELPAVAVVVEHRIADGWARLVTGPLTPDVRLPPGRYDGVLSLFCGERRQREPVGFSVGEEAADLSFAVR